MSVGVIKWNGKEMETETSLPVVYVQTTATRGYDWVEVEYNGNLYSTWIDTESDIQTGDLVWAEFYINNDIKLIGIRKGNNYGTRLP